MSNEPGQQIVSTRIERWGRVRLADFGRYARRRQLVSADATASLTEIMAAPQS